MQDATTADIIWDVAELTEYIVARSRSTRATSSRPARPSGVGVFRDPPIYLASHQLNQ